MDNEDDKITVKTAFAAMYLFLENEYRLTNSGEIGGLLGGMSLLVEGGTADPAVWDDLDRRCRSSFAQRLRYSFKNRTEMIVNYRR